MRYIKFILLIATCVSLNSCGIYKEVEFIGVEDILVKEFSATAIIIEVKAIINNPNGFDITIFDSDLDFIVNGTKLGKARFDDNIILTKKAQEKYSFMIKADMEGLASKVGLLFPILMKGKAKVKVKGDIFVKALGMKKKTPIEFVEEITF
ncbi:MAG: hypothetical protein HOK72_04420 [Flavobacteriales bacterium]|jgi:LEA14-like dessication related protein|nr:hypothetical protein [Flavobacteriales bacterium]